MTNHIPMAAEPDQSKRDAAYIWSWSVLLWLRDKGIITAAEAERTRARSQQHYKSALIVS